MRFIFTLVLAVLLQAAATQRHQVDLESLLRNPAALKKLKILYEPPVQGTYRGLFVYGDGSVVWQAYPNRPMAVTDVPTCRNTVSSDTVKHLVRLMIQKHFIDLPDKRFLFVYAARGDDDLELHTIAIDDGVEKTSRTFGVGQYAGKQESIPPDFASIEEELIGLKDAAFPKSANPCHLAPAMNFWN
jgi:hypothetical protein